MSAALKSELLKPGMTAGLYGGSFDPPHEGHAHVARTALKRLRLDRVWWLVSPGNPFKDGPHYSMAARLEMVRALVPEPRQVISALEADLPSARTADVVAYLKARHPGVAFVWVMGADAFASLHAWKAWRSIAEQVPICVVSRPGSAVRARLAPAARQLAAYRTPEIAAQGLARLSPPRWTYLSEPLHPHASRLIRARRPRPEAAES